MRGSVSVDNIFTAITAREWSSRNDCVPESYSCSSWTRYHLFPHQATLKRLGQVGELHGHQGCVNRIEWDSSGQLLLSGSDDKMIRLWRPDLREEVAVIDSGHQFNIFGVDFLGDPKFICSGAMDKLVFAHELNNPDFRKAFSCHTRRVKQVLADPMSLSVFWSASEDGTLRQFDLRERHVCSEDECHNVLCDVRSSVSSRRSPADRFSFFSPVNGSVGFKSFDVADVNPYYIVTACSHSRVLLFDRRKLSLHGAPQLSDVLTKFTIPQVRDLEDSEEDGMREIHSTFVKFSNSGTKFVASYNAQHAYMFDARTGDSEQSLSFSSPNMSYMSSVSEAKAESMKAAANEAYRNGDYQKSIRLYTKALRMKSLSCRLRAILLNNRSVAIIKRNWFGDTMLGLRDAFFSFKTDQSYEKPRLRFCQSLRDMGFSEDAHHLSKQYLGKCSEENKSKFEAFQLHGVKDESQDVEKKYEEFFSRSQFKTCFMGHISMQTDIKEICFFQNDRYVVSASDDGHVFIYEADTGEIIKVLEAGNEIVNCVRPNPVNMMPATSGIEDHIRLFDVTEPGSNADSEDAIDFLVSRNQRQLADPGSNSDLTSLLFSVLAQTNRLVS